MTSGDFWRARRVLLTGHTGFKGAWLAFWLTELGAEVTALALPPEGPLALHDQLGVSGRVRSLLADINDRPKLDEAIAAARPEVVFHLAAQSLVRQSYRNPVETFSANVVGSVQLLDAVRQRPETRAVVIVTSDKAYENREWAWGYREADALGGSDPYSASKGAAELAVRSMRRSFFAPYAQDGHKARIATVRAGNVIGGGDWAPERLAPDIVRAALMGDGTVELRNPRSVRPWQHVFDPLAFYMDLAARLCSDPDGVDDAWNVGPDAGDCRSVLEVAQAMVSALGQGRVVERLDASAPHEASLLTLDSSKARAAFGWRPRWNFDEAIRHTAEWYAAWNKGCDLVALSRAQLSAFTAKTAAGS